MSVDYLHTGLASCDAAYLLVKMSRPRPPGPPESVHTLWGRENHGLFPRIERFHDCPDTIPTTLSQLSGNSTRTWMKFLKLAGLEFSKRRVLRFLVCVISVVRFSFQSTGFIAACSTVITEACWNSLNVADRSFLTLCLFPEAHV